MCIGAQDAGSLLAVQNSEMLRRLALNLTPVYGDTPKGEKKNTYLKWKGFLLLKISDQECVLSLVPRPVRTGLGTRLGVYHVSAASDKGWAVT